MNAAPFTTAATFGIGLVFFAQALLASPAAQGPNILLLVAEDLSPRLGVYGDPVAHTPNLDRLAARGTRYTHAFSTAGVCAPSRAAIVTGMHAFSFHAQHMRTTTGPLGPYLALPPAEARAFPELLRSLGYFTYTDSKLDYQFSGIRAGSGPFTLWDSEGAADTAWRDRVPGQPFFGMINLLETHESGVMRPDGEPHSESHAATQTMRTQLGMVAPRTTDPARVPVPPYYPDLPEVRGDIARHYDNIRQMDRRVGTILAALEADGLSDSTIVVWTTDHGDGLPRAKRELYDSGIHVPLIIVRPQHLGGQPHGTDDRLVSLIDLAPTILHWAGMKPPNYFHGTRIGGPRRAFVFAGRDRIDDVYDRQRSIRSARYKYIRSWYPQVPGGHALDYRDNLDMVRAWRREYQADRLDPVQRRWFEPVGKEQLYDLEADPFETQDLTASPDHRRALQRLRRALAERMQQVGDTSEVDEAQMRAALLDDNDRIPRTPAPDIEFRDGKLYFVSPIGASIGYSFDGDPRWHLYNGAILAAPVAVKSVRYGWRESPMVRYPVPGHSP